MHHGLPAVIDALALPANFVTEWFPALIRRLGNDGDSSGEWMAIARYCEKSPAAAIEVTNALTSFVESETHMRIAAEMIGVLRSVSLEDSQRNELSAIERRLAAGSNPEHRRCYLQSWSATAYRGALQDGALEALLVRDASDDDIAERIRVICQITCAPALSEPTFLRALGWVQQQVSPGLPALTKHHIAVTIDTIAERCWSMTTHQEVDLDCLLLRILPIGSEHLGTWHIAEDFLLKQMHHDRAAFEQNLQAVGNRSEGILYQLIRSGKVFMRLISEMVVHRNDDFIARLVFQSEIGGRQLGLAVFERLGMDGFPSQLLEAVNEFDLRTALFVFQTVAVHGDVIPRFLWAVARRFEEASQESQTEFSEELALQCRNYPKTCLEALKKPSNPPSLVRSAVANADSYFEAREKIRGSPLNLMQVPGYRRMAERKWRIMNREIHDQAHE
jgi:hypothetical protein